MSLVAAKLNFTHYLKFGHTTLKVIMNTFASESQLRAVAVLCLVFPLELVSGSTKSWHVARLQSLGGYFHSKMVFLESEMYSFWLSTPS